MYTDTLERPTPNRNYFKLSTPEAMRIARKVAMRKGKLDADVLRDWTHRYVAAKERKDRREPVQGSLLSPTKSAQ